MNISVIVPNYNHLKFLPKRLETIFNQTIQDFELILLDDFSTDGSWEYLRKFENHPKVSHCIRNEFNSGSPFKQWKKGIELAKGELIWIAESDDYCENSFLKDLIPFFDKETILVYSGSNCVNQNGILTVDCNFPNWEKFDSKNYNRWSSFYSNNGYNEVREYLSVRNIIVNASSVLFRKPKNFPNEICSMAFCGDWYFWCYILQFGDIKYFPKKLNFFRTHNSSSRMKKEKYLENKRFNEIFFAIAFARKISEMKKVTIKDFSSYSYISNFYAHNFRKLNISFYNLLSMPTFIFPSFFIYFVDYLKVSFFKKIRFLIQNYFTN